MDILLNQTRVFVVTGELAKQDVEAGELETVVSLLNTCPPE